MRFGTIFGLLASLSALTLSVASEDEASDASTPDIIATATFPEANVFNHVVNGEKNTLIVAVERKSALNQTLVSIAGAILHPDTNVLIKNLTAAKYNMPLIRDVSLQFPFTFYSEFKPGDHRLNIWIETTGEGHDHQVTEVYDSIITVVEPEFSIFDLKLLSTYAMVLALLGGLGFITYRTFAPQAKKPRGKKATTAAVSAPVTVTATGAGGYQEEWIPEHHLRKTKGAKKTTVASGDDVSGAETSGTEGKRRKGKR